MKLGKRILALLLIGMFCISLFAGCGTDDLQRQIDDLNEKLSQHTNRIDDLEEENATLAGKVADLEDKLTDLLQQLADLEEEKATLAGKIADLEYKLTDLLQQLGDLEEAKETLAGKIADLEEENARLKWRIEALEEALENMQVSLGGTFYSVEEAYNNGFLTREDVMHISYFLTGAVIEVTDLNAKSSSGNPLWQYEICGLNESEWTVQKKIDFVPQMEAPVIKPKTEADIKKAYYEEHRSMFEYTGKGIDGVRIHEFLGKYNGSYALRIDAGGDYGAAVTPICIAGIAWLTIEAPVSIFVFNPLY